ncbi:MAG: type II toxin-antitoxin system RelE/ParE family toxin [Dehalococcoidia bacterium]
MIRRTIFRRVARDDVRAVRRWYEERRPGLGAAFVQSLEVCIAQIERTPEIWPRVDEETRRGRLRRFPYVVYYELDGDDILVLAVWHGRRDPEGWKERLAP